MCFGTNKKLRSMEEYIGGSLAFMSLVFFIVISKVLR